MLGSSKIFVLQALWCPKGPAKLQILQPSSCKVKKQELVLRAWGQIPVTIFLQPLLLHLGTQQE